METKQNRKTPLGVAKYYDEQGHYIGGRVSICYNGNTRLTLSPEVAGGCVAEPFGLRFKWTTFMVMYVLKQSMQ